MEYVPNMTMQAKRAYAASKVPSNMTMLQLEAVMLRAGFKEFTKLSKEEAEHIGAALIEWGKR